MKKKLLIVVLLVVAAPVLWLGSGGSPNWADHNQALGQKVAGAWLATIEIPSLGVSAEVLLNLNTDGCMVMNGQLLNPFFGGLGMNTTAHGTWRRTGPNEIEACALLFEQNDKGVTYIYEKGRFHLTLKERGTLLEGPMEINLIVVKDVVPKPDPPAPVPAGDWIPARITARPIWFPESLPGTPGEPELGICVYIEACDRIWLVHRPNALVDPGARPASYFSKESVLTHIVKGGHHDIHEALECCKGGTFALRRSVRLVAGSCLLCGHPSMDDELGFHRG